MGETGPHVPGLGPQGSQGTAVGGQGSQTIGGGMVTARADAPRRHQSHNRQPEAATSMTPTAVINISFFMLNISGPMRTARQDRRQRPGQAALLLHARHREVSA